MKKSSIVVSILFVLLIILSTVPDSFATNVITKESPLAYSVENATRGGKKGPCFNLIVELSSDGTEIFVYAQNQCDQIVKLVRYRVARGPSTGYYRPDTYIEEGVGSLILREPFQNVETYAIADYFLVDQMVERNHLLP